MKKNKNNEGLHSRREFFKKAVKGVLPVLGVIALVNVPTIIKAADEPITDCGSSCYGACYSSCKGECYRSCQEYCINTCKGTCSGRCDNNCYHTCLGSCDNTCSGSCKFSSR